MARSARRAKQGSEHVRRFLPRTGQHARASYLARASAFLVVVVLGSARAFAAPGVEIEAHPVGAITANPGGVDHLLLSLRFTNRHATSQTLTALRVTSTGPASTLRLRLDDGNGSFDPGSDAALADGAPTAGAWTASALSVSLAPDETATLFVTVDVPLTSAPHGTVLDASVESDTDLTWSTSPTVSALNGFPLDSAGSCTVRNLVQAQIAFTPQPPDTTFPGARSVPVLQLRVPDDGNATDTLHRLDVNQIGSALTGTDIEALYLETSAAGIQQMSSNSGAHRSRPGTNSTWERMAPLVHTGANRWSASGLGLAVGAGGLEVRIVADIASGAAEGRTIQLELPTRAIECESGREGPVDTGWSNPHALTIQAQRQLDVRQVAITALPTPVPRTAANLAVLAIELTALSAQTDTLLRLNLRHTSSGPTGAAADRNAQIERGHLWLDAARNGRIDPEDVIVATWDPANTPADEIAFAPPVDIALPPGTPIGFLVTLSPDSTRVRDAERISVGLNASEDVVVSGGLEVLIPQPLRTQDPPVIDGQSAQGYAIAFLQGRVSFTGTSNVTVLDLHLPSNGVDDDVLEAFRIENAGTATRFDVAAMRLVQDDGDGVPSAGDIVVAPLVPVGERTWEATGLAFPLPASSPRRYRVAVDFSASAQSGRTMQARLPRFGVTVASGNDGPNDAAVLGGEPLVLSTADEITWLAGVSGNHTVPPDASQRVLLVLEAFNGYSTVRTLRSVEVVVQGSVQPQEFLVWSLHDDANRNGIADELPLHSVNPTGSRVRFDGFALSLQPLEQRRLLVTYSLAPTSARDGSTIDARVEDPSAFTYALGSTISNGSFALDSPGQDVIDGHIRAQVESRDVSSQTLGGDERDVLTLDLVIPSNGFSADALHSLALELVGDRPAVFGVDVLDLSLWRESDPDWNNASFDPAVDTFLRTVTTGPSGLVFDGLDTEIGVGGQRFYVGVDIGAAPTDSVQVQLRVPVDGIQVASGNDGPVDAAVLGTAVHTISSSDLLASAVVSATRVSRGQGIDLKIVVRNRGSAQLDAVVPLQLVVEPASAATLLSGATPAQFDLAPAAVDTFSYRFSVDVEGSVSFRALVGQSVGSMQSNVAHSPVVRVEVPPSGLNLQLISSLPASVNRGQTGVTPLVWRLSHPDSDPFAATIAINALRFDFETAAGGGQAASRVLSALEVRTGTLIHARWDSIPNDSFIELVLDEPVVLRGGETRDLPLSVTIAPDALAADFRIRLSGTSAIEAVDANSAEAVGIVATLPWTTQSATVRTTAPRIDLTPVHTLPAAVNSGQQGIPAGRLTFSLPGASGESEVRVTEIEFGLYRPNGGLLRASDVLSSVRVKSDGTSLFHTTNLTGTGGNVRVQLSIPKVVASGATESIDLEFDMLSTTPVDSFVVSFMDSSSIVVRDANAGSVVPVAFVAPAVFPWNQGPVEVQTRANSVTLNATSTLPDAALRATGRVNVARFVLRHSDAPGAADVELQEMRFRILDDTGSTLSLENVLTAARLLIDGVPSAEVASPPGAQVTLAPSSSLRIAPGDSVQLDIDMALHPSITVPWLRAAFDVDSFVLRDANETQHRPSIEGLPFSTTLMRVLAEADGVLLGPLQDPPANVVRGSTGVELMQLSIRHPGAENEAAIRTHELVVTLRDAAGLPLAVDEIAQSAALRLDDARIDASVSSDSLVFDLSEWTLLGPGERQDPWLELDFVAEPRVQDFRLELQRTSLVSTSENGPPLTVSSLPGSALPYTSPTIHLGAANLRDSFRSYPNPFTPGQSTCRVTFFLQADARVTCEIYTLSGEPVARMLSNAPMKAGLYDDIAWNGRNGKGDLVRNGTYLLRLVVHGPGGGEFFRRVAVIR